MTSMEEESELFRQTCNSAWFQDAPTVLILNKADVFREKIENQQVTLTRRKEDDPSPDYFRVHERFGPNGTDTGTTCCNTD